MADAIGHDRSAAARWKAALVSAAQAAGPALLFGLRLWASVCLAIFVAFWLQYDGPNWAGLSAAIACRPGASLRKAEFLMIGTVVGATMIVVLTAFFPQDRIAFLGLLAVWGGICAFGATVLHNFASYGAALAGFTAAIIAGDNLGATGGASPDVFRLAIMRASEICIGIACAGIVLTVIRLGGAPQRLAASFANLAAEITGQFTRMLALAGQQLPNTQTERRELVRRVIALDPMIDEALGESSQVHYHSQTLQTAVHGLFRAMDGWGGVATHLRRLPADMDRQPAETILHSIPLELRWGREPSAPEGWLADPLALRRICEEAVRRLLVLPAGTPSLRLLADEAAKVLDGMLHVLDGLALLIDAPSHSFPSHRRVRLGIPDWLPALVNAARAFVTIGAAALFWVATAWPNGGSAIIFAAAVVLSFAPRGDLAYGGAIVFTLGAAGATLCAAIIKFAVLPGLVTFPALCAAIGLVLVPVGFAMIWSRQPAVVTGFTVCGILFTTLLGPTNPMTYDTEQFYNFALSVFAGCLLAALSFQLLPSVPPTLRVRRLLALTLRDLRRLAIDPLPPSSEDWESRIYDRLAALPDQADALQLAQLMAALSVGTEIVKLRIVAPRLGVAAQLDAALRALAQGNSVIAIARLRQLSHNLASAPDGAAEMAITLRARAHILGLSEALTAYSPYFDSGTPA
jgi:uncharacterized membrane protein YccC